MHDFFQCYVLNASFLTSVPTYPTTLTNNQDFFILCLPLCETCLITLISKPAFAVAFKGGDLHSTVAV